MEWNPVRVLAVITNIISATLGLWQIAANLYRHLYLRKTFHRQAGLRLTSYLFCTLSVLCHQMEFIYNYSVTNDLSAQEKEFLFTLSTSYAAAYAVFSLLGVFSYIGCLMDRFVRLEMIVSGSFKQRILSAFQVYYHLLFSCTIVLEIIWRVLNIGKGQQVLIDFFRVIQFCELACYLTAIATEFFVNIRLLAISIQTVTQHPRRKALLKFSKAKYVFKMTMVYLFILLVFMDLGMIVIGFIPTNPDIIALVNIMSAWMVFHAFISFKLLDIFLAKLSYFKHGQNYLRNATEGNSNTAHMDVAGNTFEATTTRKPSKHHFEFKSKSLMVSDTVEKVSVDIADYEQMLRRGLQSSFADSQPSNMLDDVIYQSR